MAWQKLEPFSDEHKLRPVYSVSSMYPSVPPVVPQVVPSPQPPRPVLQFGPAPVDPPRRQLLNNKNLERLEYAKEVQQYLSLSDVTSFVREVTVMERNQKKVAELIAEGRLVQAKRVLRQANELRVMQMVKVDVYAQLNCHTAAIMVPERRSQVLEYTEAAVHYFNQSLKKAMDLRNQLDEMSDTVADPAHLLVSTGEDASTVPIDQMADQDRLTNEEQEAQSAFELTRLCSRILAKIKSAEDEIRSELLMRPDSYDHVLETLAKVDWISDLAAAIRKREEVNSMRMNDDLKTLYERTVMSLYRASREHIQLRQLLLFVDQQESRGYEGLPHLNVRGTLQELFGRMPPGCLCSTSLEVASQVIKEMDMDPMMVDYFKIEQSDGVNGVFVFPNYSILLAYKSLCQLYSPSVAAGCYFNGLSPFRNSLEKILELYGGNDELCALAVELMGSDVSLRRREFVDRLFKVTY